MLGHVTSLYSLFTVLLAPWTPTPDEVAAIVCEMRPIIARLAARDLERLQDVVGVTA